MNTTITKDKLNGLIERAYKIARDHGWHEKGLSEETYKMLIITEVSEAVNADRKGRRADLRGFELDMRNAVRSNDKAFTGTFEYYIKDTVEDELADVCIRIMDFMGDRGQEFDAEPVLRKIYLYETASFAECAFCECDHLTQLLYPVEEVLLEVLAYCQTKGIDILRHIELKMRYNELRPYRHGNLKY